MTKCHKNNFSNDNKNYYICKMNVGDEVIVIGDSIYYNGYRKGVICKIIGKCYSERRGEMLYKVSDNHMKDNWFSYSEKSLELSTYQKRVNNLNELLNGD